jgi:hypothetical protein
LEGGDGRGAGAGEAEVLKEVGAGEEVGQEHLDRGGAEPVAEIVQAEGVVGGDLEQVEVGADEGGEEGAA